MIRGFVTGVIWGGVVATTGLAVLSQVAPMPKRDGMAEATAETAPEAAEVTTDPAPVDPAPDQASDPAPEAGTEVEAATDADVAADAAPEPAPEPAPELAPEPAPEEAVKAPQPEILQPEILQKVPDPIPEEEVAAPAASDDAPLPAPIPENQAPTDEVPPAAAPAPATAGPAPVQPDALVDAAPEAPAMPALTEEVTLPEAVDEAAPGLAEVTPPAVPESEAAPVAPAAPEEALLQPVPEAPAAPAPALIVPDAPLPQLGADDPDESDIALAVPGVRTDRLPRIGDEADAAPEEMGAAPGVVPEEALAEVLEGTTPLELFRRDFDNPEAKPIFGLILIDEGLPAAERETLAALPFPVTFALDPLAPYSAEAARVYRAAGQEVAMLANGIPEGATPGDLEQSFQALDMAMPEAVAVLDRVEGGFQDSLDLARQAVPIVAEQGRGIVTYDRGLNSADQVARREGVPRATIFRVLDSEGESIPKMRNYLDRAAFKAAQEGRVLVIGRARAETVAAILEWTVEGRAASVALAPLSAVLETTPNP